MLCRKSRLEQAVTEYSLSAQLVMQQLEYAVRANVSWDLKKGRGQSQTFLYLLRLNIS